MFREGLITVKNEIYTLMLTDNKRELLFTADGIFTDTNPYVLSNGSLLTNKDLLEASTPDL